MIGFNGDPIILSRVAYGPSFIVPKCIGGEFFS
jgi:hypothetical protein